MSKYVACVDAGTSGERCIIYDLKGNSVGEGYYEVSSIYPRNGWAEQDPAYTLEMAVKAYEDGEKKLQPTGQSILQTCAKLTKLGARQSDKNPLPELQDIDEIPLLTNEESV